MIENRINIKLRYKKEEKEINYIPKSFYELKDLFLVIFDEKADKEYTFSYKKNIKDILKTSIEEEQESFQKTIIDIAKSDFPKIYVKEEEDNSFSDEDEDIFNIEKTLKLESQAIQPGGRDDENNKKHLDEDLSQQESKKDNITPNYKIPASNCIHDTVKVNPYNNNITNLNEKEVIDSLRKKLNLVEEEKKNIIEKYENNKKEILNKNKILVLKNKELKETIEKLNKELEKKPLNQKLEDIKIELQKEKDTKKIIETERDNIKKELKDILDKYKKEHEKYKNEIRELNINKTKIDNKLKEMKIKEKIMNENGEKSKAIKELIKELKKKYNDLIENTFTKYNNEIYNNKELEFRHIHDLIDQILLNFEN